MAKYLAKNYNITKIYSSPLKRAQQTALELKKVINIEIILDSDLMEFNNGLIAGLPFTKAKKLFPRITNLPIHKAIYKQESKLDFRYRAEKVLSKIIHENNKKDTIAIISHGGLINQLTRSFLQLPIDTDIYIKTNDTGIHEWLINENEKMIIYTNNHSHLDF